MTRPPNLLVIMVDQLRASALRLYGNQQLPTPHLESLAASGILYGQAFTPYPVCVPARTAFWTGRWPHLTGSRSNGYFLQPSEIHLVTLLRDAGYATALIGKNHCFTRQSIERSFDLYYPVGHGGPIQEDGDPGVRATKEWIQGRGGARGPAYNAMISPFPVETHGTWLIGDRAEAFIRNHHAADSARPFCAWVSIADPHTPYQISEPYASRFPPATLELPPHEPPGYPGKPERVRLLAELMGAHDVSDDHLRFVLSVYYAMVALIDDVVGRLLHTLDGLGLREETIVVFTADHGDYMTEHRLVRKGASMYDSLVRVPLLLSYPGGVLPAGAVSQDLVSLLDVFPTLTQLMGVPLPPGRSGQPLPVATDAAPRSVVFAEVDHEGRPLTRAEVYAQVEQLRAAGRLEDALPWGLAGHGRMKMVRTRAWKYVHQPHGEHELYHLTADPYELTNLVDRPEHRERICDLQRALLDWTIDSEDTLPLPTPPSERA